jgi:hypothetical protein
MRQMYWLPKLQGTSHVIQSWSDGQKAVIANPLDMRGKVAPAWVYTSPGFTIEGWTRTWWDRTPN